MNCSAEATLTFDDDTILTTIHGDHTLNTTRSFDQDDTFINDDESTKDPFGLQDGTSFVAEIALDGSFSILEEELKSDMQSLLRVPDAKRSGGRT
jgi:hypothetical protein